ncbi:hypothetical protein DSO57_1034820 [Entomophthora muscae]|uniref:Uncharacterized protein n=1 Tax=Entomophthora muscae TaxID=34485 RepID=A0ACC2UA48_9FUNG|nr:hypothetical protein DSO57_1034820 [Entomophthora muscae]
MITLKAQPQHPLIDTGSVRNDNLNALESQSMEPGSNPEQNPLQTASFKDWESDSSQSIDKVVFNLPGPESLTTPQGFASKLPVRDAGSFPKVPMLDMDSFLGEMHKPPNESCSKPPEAQEGALNLNACPTPELPNRRIQIILIPKRPVATCQC